MDVDKEFQEFKKMSDLFYSAQNITHNDLELLNGCPEQKLWLKTESESFKCIMDSLIVEILRLTKYDDKYNDGEDSISLITVFYGGFQHDTISKFQKYKMAKYIPSLNLDMDDKQIKKMLNSGKYGIYYLKLDEALKYYKETYLLGLDKIKKNIYKLGGYNRIYTKRYQERIQKSIKYIDILNDKIKDKVKKARESINIIENFWLDCYWNPKRLYCQKRMKQIYNGLQIRLK